MKLRKNWFVRFLNDERGEVLPDPASKPAGQDKPVGQDAPAAGSEDAALDKLMDRDEKNQGGLRSALSTADKPKEEKPKEEALKEEPKKPEEGGKPVGEDKPKEEKPKEEAAKPLVEPTAQDILLDKLNKTFEQLGEKLAPKAKEEPKKEPEAPAFKPWEPTDEDVDNIIEGGVKTKETLKKIYGAALKDTFTLLEKPFQQLAQQSAQFNNYLTGLQVQKSWDKFFDTNKDLIPVKDLANDVALRMIEKVQKGELKPFDSEDALHKQIAETTRNYIKSVQGNGGALGNGSPSGEQTDNGPEPKGAPAKGARRRGDDGVKAPKTEDGRLMKELFDEI